MSVVTGTAGDSMDWSLPYPSRRQPICAANVVATSQPLAAQAGADMQLLYEREICGEPRGRIDIGRLVAELAVHLRECRAADAPAPVRNVQMHERTADA